jgi:hypothetical protein
VYTARFGLSPLIVTLIVAVYAEVGVRPCCWPGRWRM